MLKTSAHQPAFTLAELLVTLGLLGVIAAFTIPKLAQGANSEERNANFKKAIATLQTLLDDGVRTADLTDTTVKTYFLDNVKAVRKCKATSGTNNYVTGGCSDTVVDASNGAGFVLNGGITVVDFDDGGCTGDACGDRILVDWNGKKAPNTEGIDQMQLCFSYGVTNWTVGSTALTPGTLVPCPDKSASVTLYNTIMN